MFWPEDLAFEGKGSFYSGRLLSLWPVRTQASATLLMASMVINVFGTPQFSAEAERLFVAAPAHGRNDQHQNTLMPDCPWQSSCQGSRDPVFPLKRCRASSSRCTALSTWFASL